MIKQKYTYKNHIYHLTLEITYRVFKDFVTTSTIMAIK